MSALRDVVDEAAARARFSGVVRVDRAGRTELAVAYGMADRAHAIAMTVETRLGIASGTKGLTALAVASLVQSGALRLSTTARSLLGEDLPLVDERVTVEHLLAHRSGIGDYIREGELGSITDYVLTQPVHRFTSTEAYLPALDGHRAVFTPGERFAYNNAGFVVLALLAERAAGVPFTELVRTLVTEPAGMAATAFLRSDELPDGAALGYLDADGLRTNVLHLPVVGCGDGGIYSTAADLHALWDALFAGRLVPLDLVAELVRPRSDWPQEHRRYGLGFHLEERGDGVFLEGYDAGISFTSLHRPSTALTVTVMAGWSDGAWPLVRVLVETLGR